MGQTLSLLRQRHAAPAPRLEHEVGARPRRTGHPPTNDATGEQVDREALPHANTDPPQDQVDTLVAEHRCQKGSRNVLNGHRFGSELFYNRGGAAGSPVFARTAMHEFKKIFR
ncbi:MAG TPA: hypothetical protein DDZ76_12295 [Xanthomonadales bacterium]|nr:hypothetical protein [Xanthomonadales bacterium]